MKKRRPFGFDPPEFGDDKDRVVRTADGRTTYFVADIAYHLNKFARGLII